jgi:hypothetical protein
MKIKIEAVIDVSDFVNGLSDDEEWEWFFDEVVGKSMVILHDNDTDTLGETKEFTWSVV